MTTSICAFIGSPPRGPINVTTEMFSFVDFASIFGDLTLDAGKPQLARLRDARFFSLDGGSDAIIEREAAVRGMSVSGLRSAGPAAASELATQCSRR